MVRNVSYAARIACSTTPSLPPNSILSASAFTVDVRFLSDLLDTCMDNEGYDRIVVEKPFGRDYDSSRELNTFLQSLFAEEAIYVRLIECI